MDDRYKKMFNNPILSIMRNLFPEFKIDRAGRDLVAKMMFEIHAILIKQFEDECDSAGNSILESVHAAVSASLPPDICRHALANASRKLLLFKRGLIVYDDVRSLKRFTPVCIFKDGIQNLALLSSGATSVPKLGDSGKTMAEVLSSILDFISTKVANYSSRQNLAEIGSDHVMEVVKDVLPKSLFEHANLRGYSSIKDCELGMRNLMDKQVPKRKIDGGKSPPNKRIKSGRQHLKGKMRSKSQDPSTVFKTGNKKILLGLTNGESVRFPSEVNEKVSQVLYDIASFLSSEVSDHLRNQSSGEMDFLEVKQVMNEHFSRNLFEHAVLCGLKSVNNYVHGDLKYRRRKPPAFTAKSVAKRAGKRTVHAKKSAISKSRTARKRRVEGKTISKSHKSGGRIKSKSKSPKTLRAAQRPKLPSKRKAIRKVAEVKGLDFSKGISEIYTMLRPSPSFSMGSESKERINSFLMDVLRCLIQECSALKSPVTPETVRSATEKFLPRHITRHATAHADQKIGVEVSVDKDQDLLV